MIESMEREHIGCRRSFYDFVICGIPEQIALMGVGASVVSRPVM